MRISGIIAQRYHVFCHCNQCVYRRYQNMSSCLYLNSDTELRQEDYKNRLKQLQIRIKRCDRVIVINL